MVINKGDIVRIFKIDKLGMRVNFEDRDIVAYVDEVNKTSFKAGGITFMLRNSMERGAKSVFKRKAIPAEEKDLENYKVIKEERILKKKLVRELKFYTWENLDLKKLEEIKKLLEVNLNVT